MRRRPSRAHRSRKYNADSEPPCNRAGKDQGACRCQHCGDHARAGQQRPTADDDCRSHPRVRPLRAESAERHRCHEQRISGGGFGVREAPPSGEEEGQPVVGGALDERPEQRKRGQRHDGPGQMRSIRRGCRLGLERASGDPGEGKCDRPDGSALPGKRNVELRGRGTDRRAHNGADAPEAVEA